MVATHELPWIMSTRAHQLRRSCALQPNNIMPQSFFACMGLPRGEQRHNPVGVDEVLRARTQGSSFLATLGFEAESLWDSRCALAIREVSFTREKAERTPRLCRVRR